MKWHGFYSYTPKLLCRRSSIVMKIDNDDETNEITKKKLRKYVYIEMDKLLFEQNGFVIQKLYCVSHFILMV